MQVASNSAAQANNAVQAGPYVRQFHKHATSFESFGVEKQAKGIKILTSVLAREVLGGGNLGAILAADRGIDRLSTCTTLGAELMYLRHSQSKLDPEQSELLKKGIVCHLNTLFINVLIKATAGANDKPKKYDGVGNDVGIAKNVLVQLKAEKPEQFPKEPCALLDFRGE
jgi:hypothetical protein